MKNDIPLFLSDIDKNDIFEVSNALKNNYFLQSDLVRNFESEICKYTYCQSVAVVSSGTAALHLAFMALELKHQDVVFIPDFGWPSATNIALLMGLKVILVDVKLDTLNIDEEDLVKKIEYAISNGLVPKVIVHIHQFGLIADIEKTISISKKHNLLLLEDAACALGAFYNGHSAGTFGDIGIFSFHPRKSITTGEGGAVISNNPKYIDRVKTLRNHGQILSEGNRIFITPGFNYRMSYFQAALGISQFKKLSSILDKRSAIAKKYLRRLHHLTDSIILPLNLESHSWQTFSFTVINEGETEKLIDHYESRGIRAIRSSAGSSNIGIHENLIKSGLPVSTKLLNDNIAIPIYSSLKRSQMNRIIRATIEFFVKKIDT
jgi:perosamine synthetase